MVWCEMSNVEGLLHAEDLSRLGAEERGDHAMPCLVEREEPLIKEGVEVGGEQEAIKHIEPLAVGFAVRPGFDMAGHQQLPHVKARDGANILPITQKPSPKKRLPDAYDDDPFGLGRFW